MPVSGVAQPASSPAAASASTTSAGRTCSLLVRSCFILSVLPGLEHLPLLHRQVGEFDLCRRHALDTVVLADALAHAHQMELLALHQHHGATAAAPDAA